RRGLRSGIVSGAGSGGSLMTGEKLAPNTGTRIASAGALELVLPQCDKGLGNVIGAIDSPDLIAGVRLAQLSVFPDDRGYFMEVQRFGRGLAAEFPAATSQV